MAALILGAVLILMSGCSENEMTVIDSSTSVVEAGTSDGAPTDTGAGDAGAPDAGAPDAAAPDATLPDAASGDAGFGSFTPDMMNMTFEGTTVGMSASGGSGWPLSNPLEGSGAYADGRNIWEFSDEQVFAGSRSMRINIVDQTDSETNTVGGSVANSAPSFVGEGDEFWWRTMVYLPADHNPGTIGSSDVKWFRVYRQTSGGAQKGALEFKLAGGGSYRFGNEFGTEFHNVDPPAEDRWTTGWNAFELYVKFSTGGGVVRFWRNNHLIYEFTVVTLPGGADRMWRTQFIAYWNCARRGQCSLSDAQNDRVPQTQMPIYVDNMIATTSGSPPVNRDAAGNLFIGGGV